MRQYYPLLLDIKGRPCIIVGGGMVALRKVQGILDAGGIPVVVSTSFCDGLRNMSNVELRGKSFDDEDVIGAALVIAATDDREVNRRVADAARGAGIPVNVVDDPELCTFILPAVVRRGSLLFAISSGGASPALARRARERIEETFGDEWGQLAQLLGQLREDIIKRVPDERRRRELFLRLANDDMIRTVRDAGIQVARERIEEMVGRW